MALNSEVDFDFLPSQLQCDAMIGSYDCDLLFQKPV